MSAVQRPRSLGLRFSHAVLGVAVVHQLIGSEWMARPWRLERASAWQAGLLDLHEWAGLAAAAMLLMLLRSLYRRYGAVTVARFLPWLDGEGRRELAGEGRQVFAALRSLKPPTAAQTECLAAAVQGLGLLTLLFFAVTGTAMWLLEDNLDLMHRVGSIHELGALPLKLYLFGHAGMAFIHEWRGEGLMRRMFVAGRS